VLEKLISPLMGRYLLENSRKQQEKAQKACILPEKERF
jgi:hypothetical protein